MKAPVLFLLTLLLPFVVAANSNNHHLRHNNDKNEGEQLNDVLPTLHREEEILTPKAAPVEYIPRSYSAQHNHRRLDSSTINAAVAAAIPGINALFQPSIPDPITIDATSTSTYTATGVCGGSTITGTYYLGTISGTSSTAIDTMEVVEGTDTFTCGCGTSTFTGDFNTVMSASSYSLAGTISLSAATTCTSYSTPYTGTVTNPKFTSVIYIDGTISANSATINSYEIKSITATCDSTSVTYTNSIPSEYSSLLDSFNTDLGTEMKNYVSTTLTGIITTALNTALSQSFTIPLGLGGGLPLIMGFYRAEAERQFANLESQYRDTVQGWQDQTSGLINKWAGKGEDVLGRYGITVGDVGPLQRV